MELAPIKVMLGVVMGGIIALIMKAFFLKESLKNLARVGLAVLKQGRLRSPLFFAPVFAEICYTARIA